MILLPNILFIAMTIIIITLRLIRLCTGWWCSIGFLTTISDKKWRVKYTQKYTQNIKNITRKRQYKQ